ncbi:MotB family protein [Endothiovibrio diazotrophicus]
MSDEDDDQPPKKCPPGPAAWIMTFADLMSLLLAFFVLLFSFSELDKQKYKQVSGSMKDAFGVQAEVRLKESPKGVSFVAREFSPGVVMPTAINRIRQTTTDVTRMNPRIQSSKPQKKRGMEKDLMKLRQAMAPATREGLMELEDGGERIIIRLKDQGLFESASAELTPKYRQVVADLGKTLSESKGVFSVAGHTDDVPIITNRFRSNWDLSTARAVSVLQVLMESTGAEPDRFEAKGYGDTRPLTGNDTPEGRKENRRVEIAIEYDRPNKGGGDETMGKEGDKRYGFDDHG